MVSIPLWFDWKISRAFNTASFSCFNSTLVRLEVFFLQCAAEGLLSFNSTLVRLEAFQALLGSTRNKVSIPLWFDWKRYRKPVCSAQTRFNSTLVRLEELTPEGYRQGGLFQFHFGSIGSPSRSNCMGRPNTFQFHFGSIGRRSRSKCKKHRSKFQFHFGSIGRFPRVRNFTSRDSFNSTLVRLEDYYYTNSATSFGVSIPLWFDWKKKRAYLRAYSYFVSIPLWFDWKKTTGTRIISTITVSIPLWFDWKPKAMMK